MNPPVLLLRALKGTCALNCLAALHLAGPLPITQRTVMDLTGYDDAAVRKGLHTLLVLGLASSAGQEHRTAWQLAPAARDLPLPLYPILENPEKWESHPVKEEEQEIVHTDSTESISDSSSTPGSPNPSLAESSPIAAVGDNTAAAEPAAAVATVPTPAPSAPTSDGQSTHANAHASFTEKTVRAHYYAIFEAANIYLQFRRPLADALLAEDRQRPPGQPPGAGPSWLCQALGWLCYAQRRLPHVQRGAVVFISLRDRLPCDSAYLPPPELPFEAALAWALRGGEPETPAAEQTNEPDDADHDTSQTLNAFDGPEDPLWRAVLDRLSRELPRGVLDSQLRPVRLVSLDHERCVLAAPNPQARDWLATRLIGVLERALREVTGQVVMVDVRCEI